MSINSPLQTQNTYQTVQNGSYIVTVFQRLQHNPNTDTILPPSVAIQPSVLNRTSVSHHPAFSSKQNKPPVTGSLRATAARWRGTGCAAVSASCLGAVPTEGAAASAAGGFPPAEDTRFIAVIYRLRHAGAKDGDDVLI